MFLSAKYLPRLFVPNVLTYIIPITVLLFAICGEIPI